MPEVPWFKWFPSDWLSEPCLTQCSPAARGIWMDMLCSMHLMKTGEVKGTEKSFSRMCRCSEADILDALLEFEVTKTAIVTKQNGSITVASRRMRRERAISVIRAEAGSKGGSSGSKKEAKPKAKPQAKPSSSSSSSKSFTKPTLEQVTAYIAEIRAGIDPQGFLDSNDAKGWLVGKTKTPMKDWKAVVRTWESNRKKGGEQQQLPSTWSSDTPDPTMRGKF